MVPCPRSRGKVVAAFVAIAAVFVLLGGCGDDDESATDSGAEVTRVRVTVGGAPPLHVEVAETPAERRRGLMDRESLEPGTGMLFLFPSPREGSFWMYKTLVPLSIVWAADGKVVGVAEMDPCPHDDPDRCPRFMAPAAFDLAVEAPAGTFTDAGVRAGDTVRIDGELPDPS